MEHRTHIDHLGPADLTAFLTTVPNADPAAFLRTLGDQMSLDADKDARGGKPQLAESGRSAAEKIRAAASALSAALYDRREAWATTTGRSAAALRYDALRDTILGLARALEGMSVRRQRSWPRDRRNAALEESAALLEFAAKDLDACWRHSARHMGLGLDGKPLAARDCVEKILRAPEPAPAPMSNDVNWLPTEESYAHSR